MTREHLSSVRSSEGGLHQSRLNEEKGGTESYDNFMFSFSRGHQAGPLRFHMNFKMFFSYFYNGLIAIHP